jgi:tRNA1Val (adenine37-N6)-methyltransferase
LFKNKDESIDEIFHGRLRVIQKLKGYRFSLDPILLCSFVDIARTRKALDLGTGCGIIPLILAKKNESIRIVGVEVQEELADLARRNIELNQLSDRVEIIHGDMRDITPDIKRGSFDLVVSNPPFMRANCGRINPLRQKAIARHELLTSIEDVIKCAREFLIPKGRLALIYPAQRTVHLMFTLRDFRFEPKRFRAVHSYRNENAKMVLVESVMGGGEELEFLPPLVIYEESGKYTDEMNAIYRML